MSNSLHEAAQTACSNIGVIFQSVPTDGKFHQLDVEGKATRNGAGRIRLYPDGEGGQVWNHVTTDTLQFWAKSNQTFTPAEAAARRQQREEDNRRAEVLVAEERAAAVKLAGQVWKVAGPVLDSVYFNRKGVTPTDTLKEITLSGLVKMIGYTPAVKGESFTGSKVLIVPVFDGTKITTIEMISEKGLKAGLKGGQKKGGFWSSRKLPDGDGTGLVIGIGEGVSTMLTYNMASGNIGIAALSCGNLAAVAKYFRERYRTARLEIVSDVGNGEQAALEAARAVDGYLIKPTFADGSTGTDINDLHMESGNDAVILCLQAATMPEPIEEPAPPPFNLSRLTRGADISAGDYSVTFVVDKLIPENALILFYAKGGSGKSTLATQIATAVTVGLSFMGLVTLKRPVVIIDFENPLAVLRKRINAVSGAENVFFWTGNNTPPQLNKKEWLELKDLVTTLENPLIIIDTLSSACSGLDILNNGDFSPVMQRLVELRNLGATIVLLHHTPKSDETKYIGASCIYNQVDHVIAMYPVKTPGQEKEVVDEDEAKVYRFGTKDKTRFEHYALYVEFDEDKGCFVPAANPDQDILDRLQKLITEQRDINQTGIINQIGADVPKAKLKRLLKHNEGRLWSVESGTHNAKIYRPISSYSVFSPIGANNWITENQLFNTHEKQAGNDTQQTTINSELVSYSTPFEKHEKQDDFVSLPVFDF